MKASQRIADALIAEGVEAVFALMGDGNMMLLDALADKGVRVVQARHEGAALAMADGYARASGRVGVCTVTSGPGLTQTLTSLTVATRHRSPVLLIAGDTASRRGRTRPGQPGFQQLDQGPLAAGTGAAYRVLRLASLDEDVCAALAQARRERRPVVLGAPIDVQEAQAGTVGPYRPGAPPGPDQEPTMDGDAIAAAARRLAVARRPVVLAGAGVVQAGSVGVVAELARRCGALIATTLLAKDAFAGEPFVVGLAGGFSRATARELLAEADCVVAVGASLSAQTTDNGTLFAAADVIQIDLAPHAHAVLPVRGDLCRVVPALTGMLDPAVGYRTADVAARLADAPRHDDATIEADRAGLEPGTLHPLDVMRELERAMPAAASLVIGVGHFWWFPAVTLTRADPRSTFYTYDFGTIGQAMPTAVGVAVATGRPVVVVDGDGSFLMNIQELETVARERIPLIAVVLNDGAYGAEVHRLGARGGDPDRARFGRPDLAAVARAFGLAGTRLTTPDDLGRAVAAVASVEKGALVIDAPTSATVVSEPYQRMFYGGRSDASPARKA